MNNNTPIFENCGLWDVEKVSVKYISYSWVQFSCQHTIVNGERDVKNVFYNPLDRIRGRSFEDKIKDKLNKFCNKMKARNEKILKLRHMSRQLKDGAK